MCQFSPSLLGTVSRTFKLCLDLARFVELLDPRCCHHVDRSASAALNKPFVALSHNEASATQSPLISAPETVSLAQFLRDRDTSNEITGLGLERLAGSFELEKLAFRSTFLLLTSRFRATVRSLVCVLHQAVNSSRTP